MEYNTNTVPLTTYEEKVDETVGFWTFFGLILLFSIPVIGLIACLIFMFAPKKKSMKNYARATMVWLALQIVSTILIVSILLTVIGNLALPSLNAQLGTDFQSAGEVLSITVDLMNGDYSSVIKQFSPQLIEALGEEYKPLVEELSNDEYNEIFKQLKDEQYDELLSDLKNKKYPQLAEAVGQDTYKKFTGELEKAANGEVSNLVDNIKGNFSIIENITKLP